MKRALLLSALLACAAAAARAQQPPPPSQNAAPPVSRKVSGRTLTSGAEPRVRVTFARGFKYAGAQSFVLYDVARAEQHFFVDADARGRVRRLYWVQFEGYLPGNDHAYDYQSKNLVRLGGFDFVGDSRALQIPRPDPSQAAKPADKISDGEYARAFLASKGYTMASGEALWQRFVHLTDPSKRNELMIVYIEDLGPTGLKAADLNRGGRAERRWDSIAKALQRRALSGMTVSRR